MSWRRYGRKKFYNIGPRIWGSSGADPTAAAVQAEAAEAAVAQEPEELAGSAEVRVSAGQRKAGKGSDAATKAFPADGSAGSFYSGGRRWGRVWNVDVWAEAEQAERIRSEKLCFAVILKSGRLADSRQTGRQAPH